MDDSTPATLATTLAEAHAGTLDLHQSKAACAIDDAQQRLNAGSDRGVFSAIHDPYTTDAPATTSDLRNRNSAISFEVAGAGNLYAAELASQFVYTWTGLRRARVGRSTRIQDVG